MGLWIKFTQIARDKLILICGLSSISIIQTTKAAYFVRELIK